MADDYINDVHKLHVFFANSVIEQKSVDQDQTESTRGLILLYIFREINPWLRSPGYGLTLVQPFVTINLFCQEGGARSACTNEQSDLAPIQCNLSNCYLFV